MVKRRWLPLPARRARVPCRGFSQEAPRQGRGKGYDLVSAKARG
ncbi:hypothetical protein BREVNS_1541 [Brevinematales bacterium NS]|nr:hypothetical protein BREVNS_1251 [Brevinematales bacterium NS]QJR22291.1 hypothetical protein BREVNS_1541 [Brevinematales bacterium NS]